VRKLGPLRPHRLDEVLARSVVNPEVWAPAAVALDEAPGQPAHVKCPEAVELVRRVGAVPDVVVAEEPAYRAPVGIGDQVDC
jgi:hypothetical protein